MSLLILFVYIIGICFFFLLQVFLYVRNGESASRVRTLWLAPIVVLPIAFYFCSSADILHSAWLLLAAGLSLIVGATLEWVHVHSAQVIPDMQHRTLRLEGSSRMVLLVLMLLDAICYATLLMLILSLIPALHTPLFRQFAPYLTLFSLGSRGVHALVFSQRWKEAQKRHNHDYETAQGHQYR